MKRADILFGTLIIIIILGSITLLFWGKSIVSCINVTCFSLLAFQGGVNEKNRSTTSEPKYKPDIMDLVILLVLLGGIIFSFKTFVWVTIADFVNPRMRIPGVLSIFAFSYLVPSFIGEWARKFDWVKRNFLYPKPENNQEKILK